MEPVFVLFWMTLAVMGGFLVAHVARAVSGEADISISAAILTSFIAIGLFLGSLAGNPWIPTLIAIALTGGLAWACLDWHLWECRILRAVTRALGDWLAQHTGNHEWHSSFEHPSWRERWSRRLARWGFPSQYQMEVEAILREMRRNRDLGLAELSNDPRRRFSEHSQPDLEKFLPGV